jgi:hypothetical protein
VEEEIRSQAVWQFSQRETWKDRVPTRNPTDEKEIRNQLLLKGNETNYQCADLNSEEKCVSIGKRLFSSRIERIITKRTKLRRLSFGRESLLNVNKVVCWQKIAVD